MNIIKFYSLVASFALLCSCVVEEKTEMIAIDTRSDIGLIDQFQEYNNLLESTINDQEETRGRGFFTRLWEAVCADVQGWVEIIMNFDYGSSSDIDYLMGSQEGIPGTAETNASVSAISRSRDVFNNYQSGIINYNGFSNEEERFYVVENVINQVVENPQILYSIPRLQIKVPVRYYNVCTFVGKLHNYALLCSSDTTYYMNNRFMAENSIISDTDRLCIIESLSHSQVPLNNPITTVDSLYVQFLQTINYSINNGHDLGNAISYYTTALEQDTTLHECQKYLFYCAMSIAEYSNEFWTNYFNSLVD